MMTRSKTKNAADATDWSMYKKKGYVGLANLGNTCFMNSCLQVLNHTYELNRIFLVDKTHEHFVTSGSQIKDQEIDLVRNWVELQTMLWSNNNCAISPGKFVFSVQNLAKIKDREIFTGWAQNDMPEFLMFMIDSMHNVLARHVRMNIQGTKKTNTDDLAITCYEMLRTIYEKEYSEIHDLFYGIYVSILQPFDVASKGSKKPETFFILDLPIPTKKNTDPTTTLYDCFDLFTQKEVMEGDNAWHNDSTGQMEPATKQIQFWNLPKILVIVLKRFSNQGHLKRQDLVDFPFTGLDLSKYVCGYNPQSYVYDLYGVCNHMGGIMGGHYHCYVKNASDEWIHYNDANYTIMGSNTQVVSPAAYCLFYRKRNM